MLIWLLFGFTCTDIFLLYWIHTANASYLLSLFHRITPDSHLKYIMKRYVTFEHIYYSFQTPCYQNMEQIVTLISHVYDKDLSRLDQFESKGISVILSNIINRYTHVLYINLSSFFKKFDEYIFLFRLCPRIEIF